LWLTSARTFPLVPLLPAAGTFSTPLDWLALAALFLSTCWFWLSPSSVPIVIFLADALLLGLQDQNRLQSWLLSFALMMGAFLPHLRRGSRAWSALQTLRLLQGVTWATYFWSGLLNARSSGADEKVILEPGKEPQRKALTEPPTGYRKPTTVQKYTWEGQREDTLSDARAQAIEDARSRQDR
jgi:hypothetical protein